MRFLIKRFGWKVTKIYSHFTFEQSCVKQEFVLTNQRKRQETKSSIEKDFYKLINNGNFGNDGRDNRNNTKFLPIVDEIVKITYIKKYNLFDKNVSKFVNSNISEKQIIQEIEQKPSTIKFGNLFWAIKKSLELVKNEEMDALNCLKEKEIKGEKRKLTKNFEMRVSDMLKKKKNQTIIDFHKRESKSIKSIVVNSSTMVDVSTRFCKGKMLMFAEMLLKSIVYDIIDIFCFPDDKVKGILIQMILENVFYILT